jgi:hypothetical protein
VLRVCRELRVCRVFWVPKVIRVSRAHKVLRAWLEYREPRGIKVFRVTKASKVN